MLEFEWLMVREVNPTRCASNSIPLDRIFISNSRGYLFCNYRNSNHILVIGIYFILFVTIVFKKFV